MTSAANALVVYSDYTDKLSYLDDWLDAFRNSELFACTPANIATPAGRDLLRQEAPRAEVIVLLHSVIGDSLRDIRRCSGPLRERRGRLLAFVGNELNLPGVLLSEKIALLKDLGVDYIGTQLELEAGQWLYSETGGTVVALPHALNPEVFHPTTPDARRPIDIGTRSFRYLPTIGDDDRNRLFDQISHRTFDPPLSIDIRTDERFDRADWAAFLNTCKGTVSTEAGSFWLERDDATLTRLLRFARSRGGLTVSAGSLSHRLAQRVLPQGLRRTIRKRLGGGAVQLEGAVLEQLPFDEVYEQFFRATPLPPVYGKCISSRHFDAIGTRTCQLMIRGRFNGILEPDLHYLAIDRDLGNLDQVVESFRDPAVRARITDNALQAVMEAHTYRHRIAQAYDALR